MKFKILAQIFIIFLSATSGFAMGKAIIPAAGSPQFQNVTVISTADTSILKVDTIDSSTDDQAITVSESLNLAAGKSISLDGAEQQDVSSGASPALDGGNITGIPAGAFDADAITAAEIAADAVGASEIDETANVVVNSVKISTQLVAPTYLTAYCADLSCSGDDTSAVQDALNALDYIYIPAGAYSITTGLTKTGALSIECEDAENTILSFTGAIDGITIDASGEAIPGITRMENCTLQTNQVGEQKAFVFTGRTTNIDQQLHIYGNSFTGVGVNSSWKYGVYGSGAYYSDISRNMFRGTSTITDLTSAIYLTDSTDVKLLANFYYWADTAVSINGLSEGVTLQSSHFVPVNVGVNFASTGAYLDLSHNHISANQYGAIVGQNATAGSGDHSQLKDNLIFKRSLSSDNFVGLQINGAYVSASGNTIMLPNGSDAGGTSTGIHLNSDADKCDIDDNKFFTMNTGIELASGAVYNKLHGNHCNGLSGNYLDTCLLLNTGADNNDVDGTVYGQYVTTDVSDSGASNRVNNGIDDTAGDGDTDKLWSANKIYDELQLVGGGSGSVTTIKEDDVQVGGADIVTLDFLGTDFNTSESPDTEINISINDAGIDHNSTTNYVANQHVNWVSGAEATQDLATTGKIGIGGAVGAGKLSFVGTAGLPFIYIPSTTTTQATASIVNNPTINSANTSAHYGTQNQMEFQPSGASLTDIYSFINFPLLKGATAPDVTNMYALINKNRLDATYTGTVTNSYALRLVSALVNGGSVLNNYGLYLDDFGTGSTSNWAIYTKLGDIGFVNNQANFNGTDGGLSAAPAVVTKTATDTDLDLLEQSGTVIVNGAGHTAHVQLGLDDISSTTKALAFLAKITTTAASYSYCFNAAAGDTIMLNGVAGTAGDCVCNTAPTVGDKMSCTGYGNVWDCEGVRGTWAALAEATCGAY